MALYLGNSEKLKIILDNIVYRINIAFDANVENNIRLLSSDGYILKDSNGLYLTIKESE